MLRLEDVQMDALRELGNISSGHAVTVLSKYMNQTIEQGLSFMDIVDVGEVLKFMGGPGNELLVLDSPVSGNISGVFLVVFPGKSWHALSNDSSDRKITDLTHDERKKMKELCDTLSKEYVHTLSEIISMSIESGDSKILSGREFLDSLNQAGYKRVMMFETDFSAREKGFEGDIIFLININNMTDNEKSILVDNIIHKCLSRFLSSATQGIVTSKFYSEMGLPLDESDEKAGI